MRLRPLALLLGLALALASFSPAPPPGARPESPDAGSAESGASQFEAEEEALRAALQSDDAPAALDFLRKRTPSEAQRTRLRTLVQQLGNDEFEIREQASIRLAASGPVATAPLRAASRSPDAEVARRAREILPRAQREQAVPLLVSSVRLVTDRRPPGVVAVLLDYLPWAADAKVADEVRAALRTLTVQHGQADAALVRALESSDADQRAAAGVVLARADLRETRPAVRRLLEDEDTFVRLQVGRVLVEARDRTAIPVLIELFADLVGDERWDVEDLLERIAGEDAPALPRTDGHEVRRRRRDAWRGWWQTHGEALNLARLPDPPRAREQTLVLLADLQTGVGQALDVGSDGQPGRRLDGLRGPFAVQALSGGRVLIAEYAGKRVVETTLDGKLTWNRDLSAGPLAVQRLPGGGTFIACRNQLLEFSQAGEETWQLRRPRRDIVAARKHTNGSIVVVTDDGFCRWLDAAGQESHSFAAPGPYVIGTGIDVLPNRRVLVPRFGRDCVTEYDALGNVLWEAALPGPASAERLPDGHTLVGCTAPPLVVELDRHGQVVWQYRPERAVIQATRR
jgi:hypothetical protein